jgi:hypothetical protein
MVLSNICADVFSRSYFEWKGTPEVEQGKKLHNRSGSLMAPASRRETD